MDPKAKTPVERVAEYRYGWLTVNEVRELENLPLLSDDQGGSAFVHPAPTPDGPPAPQARAATAVEGCVVSATPPPRARLCGVPDGKRTHSMTITDVQVRAAGDDGKAVVFEGYAALFEVRAEILPGWFEEVMPGAFDGALARPDDVRFLINHNSNPVMVLGRTASGTLTLSIDEVGLKVRAELPDTQAARDLAVVMGRDDVNQMSFGFIPTREEWTEFPDYSLLCRIFDLELFDVSVVTFPAYIETTAQLNMAPPQLTLPGEQGRAVELDEEQAMAWLLERTIELRAGAVLSSENRELVEAAVEALQALLDKADSNKDRSADPIGLDSVMALISANDLRAAQLVEGRR